jgi:hypothetical protein
MLTRLTLPLAVVLFAVLAGPAAAAPVVDYVQIGNPDRAATRAFPPGLAVELTAPAGFERGCCYDFTGGEWVGPLYQANGVTTDNSSRIDWEVEFERTSKSPLAVARGAGWAGHPQREARSRRVKHEVSLRPAGTLKGAWAIDQERKPGARTQGVLAIDLGQRLKAVVIVTLNDPPADTTAAGALTVKGSKASAWNLKQAKAALGAVTVAGSMAPKRVTASVRGGRVAGKVTDAFGHAVSGVRVALERRAGSNWQEVAHQVSGDDGAFSLAAGKTGTYRAVATDMGRSVRSRPVKR